MDKAIKTEKILSDMLAITEKCHRILQLCIEHAPLKQEQIDKVVSNLIDVGESKNGTQLEEFARNTSIFAIRALDDLYID